jgi:hypothetical protein
MLKMVRNDIRFTSAKASVPDKSLTFATGGLGPPSLFGAGEYAKDGLLSITEYFAMVKLRRTQQEMGGVRRNHWQPGIELGAARFGSGVVVSLAASAPKTIKFDFARRRRILNLQQNLVRLNEFPEYCG